VPEPEKIKLAVIDDCVIFSAGLCSVLSKVDDLMITSCHDFKSEETPGFPEPPDVILIHTIMKDLEHHAKVLEHVQKMAPLAKMLLISEFTDIEYLSKILLLGCDGYVLRDVSEKALVRAIRNMSAEIFVLDRGVINKFLQPRRRENPVEDVGELSSRELRVIRMVADGMTNGKMASELGLATGTVKNIVSGLLTRFGYRKRSQLVNLLNEVD
jgi:DNA-binding NarL/FixJ family response regulator